MSDAGATQRRVLEVLFSFRVGGSEVVGIELAKHLADKGTEVLCTAIDGMDGPLRSRCAEYGLEVIDLGMPMSGMLARNGFSWRLVEKLRALRLDAIHLQHFLGLNKVGLAARLAGIPRIVVTEHSEAGLQESLAGRLRLRMNWRLAHVITVIHPGIRDYLVRELGIDGNRIEVITNGIDLGYWNRHDRDLQRQRLGVGDEFVFMYVGRVAPVKNIPGLVTAFLQAVSAVTQPSRLVIAGDGADLDACRRIAAASPHGNAVTFLGETSDVRGCLAAADAFVMNSRSEGTPRALMEAMALGLPGIAPAVGGVPAMLESCGDVVPPNDPAALVSALVSAMTQPAQSRALGCVAAERAKKLWDAEIATARYRDLLRLKSR